MAEPLVDKSVDASLAAEAEKLLAQDLEDSAEASPAGVAAAEAEADLSADVERLMRDAAPAEGGAGGSLDLDLASLTESLLNDSVSQASVTEKVEQDAADSAGDAMPAEAPAAAAEPAAQDPVKQADESVPASGHGVPEESTPEATASEQPEAEAAMNADLDAAAAEVEIPPAPEPPLPPAEAVGIAAAESIAAQEAKKNGTKVKSAPKPAKEVAGATLEDLKPSVWSKLMAPARLVGGAAVTGLAVMSKPLAKKSPVLRDSIGWLSVSTLFCGISLWGYALVFRKPPEPPTPHEPVVLMEAAGGMETTYAKRAGAAGGAGHGEAKKDAKKADAKKPDAKKAEHGAAKKPDAKKPAKAEGH